MTSTVLTVALAIGAATLMETHQAFAQHTGHQMPGQPPGASVAPSAELLATCRQSSQQALQIIARVSGRLEAARQTNSPTESRAAMDDLQAALVELRTRATACATLGSDAPAEGATGMHEGDMSPGALVMQPGSPAEVSTTSVPGRTRRSS